MALRLKETSIAFDIIQLTEELLNQAIAHKASDLHFEPYEFEYRVRMRVDGVLQPLSTYPVAISKQITTRLKILAKLNIAEFTRPQDGQLEMNHHNIRISTIPVTFGEKIVLRILDNQTKLFKIEELGLSQQEEQLYLESLLSPQGLILVTGPTGSGKTVTLYSGLNLLNKMEKNLSTVEDPIEIPLHGVNQTQIQSKMGITFEMMLRSLLRQDPDILMVGEIRDRETAEIAIQAGQTGHLVLSTLHTNSSIETLIRLNQMGISSHLLASSLKLIIAQRLVRRLCPHCKVQNNHPIKLNANLTLPIHYESSMTGCEQCINGYRGRIALYEMLPMNENTQNCLYESSSLNYRETFKTLRSEISSTLQQSAYSAIQNQITSLNEAYRVLGQDLFQGSSND